MGGAFAVLRMTTFDSGRRIPKSSYPICDRAPKPAVKVRCSISLVDRAVWRSRWRATLRTCLRSTSSRR